MSNNNAIGVYDSGIGGLTVVTEIFRHLPEESILYFGDTAHVPYGERSVEELVEFADNIIKFLINKGAKIIVAACNTTSSVALDKLTGRYPVPIVGVIKPGARAAARVTENKRVGIIGTKATINSGAHMREITALNKNIKVLGQACPKFVPLVETGNFDSKETRQAAEEYLRPLNAEGVDTLVFGCTHYPFLRPVIREIMGSEVHLVDPASETVREAIEIMESEGLIAEKGHQPQHQFYCSGSSESFMAVGKRFIGSAMDEIHQVTLD